jgi:hypothetical protein
MSDEPQLNQDGPGRVSGRRIRTMWNSGGVRSSTVGEFAVADYECLIVTGSVR